MAKRMKTLTKPFIAIILFVTILILSSGTLAEGLTDKVKIKPSTSGTTAGAQQGTCNIDTPECYEQGNCFCDVDENELLQFDLTFVWSPELFPKGTSMCVRPFFLNFPEEMSCPTATGSGEATITCTWIPTFCQSGNYTAWFDIGTTCSNVVVVFPINVSVNNINRLPVITATPTGPIETDFGTLLHIDITATDPDTQCIDETNKDVLILTQMNGPGSFVDNGEGDGDFDWLVDDRGSFSVTFRVDDGKGGSAETSVEFLVSIPTVSEWGLAVMTLLFLTVGTIVIQRRLNASRVFKSATRPVGTV